MVSGGAVAAPRRLAPLPGARRQRHVSRRLPRPRRRSIGATWSRYPVEGVGSTRRHQPPRSRPPLHRLSLICLVGGPLLAQGCSGTTGPVRHIVIAEWDTVWTTAPAFMDSTLPSPSLLTYNDGQVFVFDDGALHLAALDSRTGRLAWAVGRQGQGPLEFQGVAALFPRPGGGVLVLDIRNRRLLRFSSAGVFEGSTSLAGLGQQPNQICAVRGDHFLVADVLRVGLLEMDSSGQLAGERPSLWPDLGRAPGRPPQRLLRNDPSGVHCVVAILSGRGFALLSPGRSPITARYVETFEAYGLGARRDEPDMQFWALADAEFVADTLYALFVGRTADRYRLVDRYSAETGAYRDTYRLPFPTGEFAAGDGTLFVVDSSGTRIVALRPRQ